MIRSIKMYNRILGLPGLLCAVQAKLTHSTRTFTVRRNDCVHPFQIRIPSSDIQAYKQIFLNREYNVLSRKPPKVIVDAGAYIGLASIYFANHYPDAHIIAIEPELTNFKLLEENTRPYPNISPIHAALWNKNEEIEIFDPGAGKWGFVTGREAPQGSPSRERVDTVPALTIDKLMELYGFEKIDILKVDIEGAEKEVFSDTSQWIDKVDSIIIELHEWIKSGCSRSFYCATNDFDTEWLQGENICLSRSDCIARHPD